MSNPRVAVVIVHWNRQKLLEQFLPSVYASTYPNLDIYIADNASTDDSISYVEANFPGVKIIRLDQNYGYAGGYNHALKHVQADYYVLLNNDIEVPQNWIEPVIAEMEQDKRIGACQPKVKDFRKKNMFEYAGASGGYMDILGYVFCRGRIFDALEEDQHQYDDAQDIFWATGASMFIRGELFHEAGGLDEHFFAHMEEVDLCWRIQLLGYRLRVIPDSVVYHVGGGTLDKMSSQKTYLNFRNSLLMLTKNLPASTLLWLIPFRSFLDLLSSVYFFVRGYPLHSLAVHRAHADYFFKFAKWWKLRALVKGKKKRLREMNGVYKGSIVKGHFLMGVRSFKQINL